MVRFSSQVLLIGYLLLGLFSPQAQPRSSNEVHLPRPFARFSQNDVLAAVFTDFDRSTGRVRHILNEKQQPSLVQLDQARLWISGQQIYLVVMIAVGGPDEQFGIPGQCGACPLSSPLAVLRIINNNLQLVAKQDDVIRPTQDTEDHSTGFEAFWYTGNDYDVAFDLAPYRLKSNEMLIGVRYQHMWIPANSFTTTLLLYRIEGTRIRKVFEDVAIDRDWRNNADKVLRMEKTTSLYATVATNGAFNDLVITRNTRKCFANWDTYDCIGGELVSTRREKWQFDGTTFVKPGKG